MQSEADRRQNLIDDLLTRETQLNASFKGDITEPEPSRQVVLSWMRGKVKKHNAFYTVKSGILLLLHYLWCSNSNVSSLVSLLVPPVHHLHMNVESMNCKTLAWKSPHVKHFPKTKKKKSKTNSCLSFSRCVTVGQRQLFGTCHLSFCDNPVIYIY